jgi:alkylated DNA repair dioxygenase AlkB
MSHVDGPVYFPVVANLSLGAHTIMNLRRCRRDSETHDSESPIRLLLEPRSLLLLSSHALVKLSSLYSCAPLTHWQLHQLDARDRRAH